ncbi:MAG: hypothetical protein WBB29_14525 [Geitlerinemataceae cyanobacterium]
MDVKERCSSGYLFYRDRGGSAVANLPQDPSNEGFPSGTAIVESGNSMGSYTRLDGQTLVENGQLTPPGSQKGDRGGVLVINSQAILHRSRRSDRVRFLLENPNNTTSSFLYTGSLGIDPDSFEKTRIYN